jgi:predicted anti-sigma-YlaC factor YlaD
VPIFRRYRDKSEAADRRRLRHTHGVRLTLLRVAVAALLVAVAVAWLLFEPYRGPILLTVSAEHGVDLGDLAAIPLLALAAAVLTPLRRPT